MKNYLKKMLKSFKDHLTNRIYIEYIGRINTPEGFSVRATIEEYENGLLSFLSTDRRPLGAMTIANYRNLKMQPFKEPRVYLNQVINFLWVCLNSLGYILVVTPVCCFWTVIFKVAFEGDFKVIFAANVAANILSFNLFMATIIEISLGFLSKARAFGYNNSFKSRYVNLLEAHMPDLKGQSNFILKWEAGKGN